MKNTLIKIILLFFVIITANIFLGNYFIFASEDLGSTDFTLDVNELSPSQANDGEGWTYGTEGNINQLLANIAYLLLIVVPTLAVLFMVVGGIKIILAGGDSSKIGQGKTIITFNIIAIVISLLSYSIINLVRWILGA